MTIPIGFVVNPNSQGGQTGRRWPKIYSKILEMLDPIFSPTVKLADGLGEGLKATKLLLESGVEIIIAVGGEGTVNEVINGIGMDHNGIKLGFIRSGTVNDYLQFINWPKELRDQVELINRQEYRSIPVLRVQSKDQMKLGLNGFDIGIGAKIAYMASVERKLSWIRNSIRYQLLSLRALFSWSNVTATIEMEGQSITGELSLLTTGFSNSIGDYKVHPQAELYANQMSYTLAMNYGTIGMLKKMRMLRKGTHTPDIENLYMGTSKQINIIADEPLLFEVDGEPFKKKSTEITVDVVSNAIEIIKVVDLTTN